MLCDPIIQEILEWYRSHFKTEVHSFHTSFLTQFIKEHWKLAFTNWKTTGNDRLTLQNSYAMRTFPSLFLLTVPYAFGVDIFTAGF